MFYFPLPEDVPPLSAAQKRLLRGQRIGPDEPGPVLRDVEALLAWVGSGTPVGVAPPVLSGRPLREVSGRLSRPGGTSERLLVQHRFPYVHALYLLLRAAGLLYVAPSAGGRHLVPDAAALASWQGLNPTERYATLFAAWMTRLDEAALLEERLDPLGAFHRCYLFLSRLPEGGRSFETPSEHERLRYLPGFAHVALLDLFGLAAVEAAAEPGDTWVRRIARRPFGGALLQLTAGCYQAVLAAEDEEPAWELPALQAAFRPYFPTWQHSLEVPLLGFRDGVFVFKVSLDEAVWRRIAAPAGATLYALAEAIRLAFSLGPEPPGRFTFADPFGLSVDVNDPEAEEPPFSDEVRVGDVPVREGEALVYAVGEGEGWVFALRLEAIEPEAGAGPDPVVRGAGGDPPPPPQDDDEDL